MYLVFIDCKKLLAQTQFLYHAEAEAASVITSSLGSSAVKLQFRSKYF